MPERTGISSIVFCWLALALSACDNSTSSRAETTSFEAAQNYNVAECIERFSGDAREWAGRDVRASFVYDITALPGDKIREFWGKSPEEGGKHIGSSHTGGNIDAEIARFLEREPVGDTEMFMSDAVSLMRVNSASNNFEKSLQIGCERLREGVSIRQVTFSQGGI